MKSATETNPAPLIAKQFDHAAEVAARLRGAISQVVIGQEAVIEQVLITLLAGGHGMLVGVPGLAKTLLVDTIGIATGLDTKRVQFTPDLMPTDITGTEVLEESAKGSRAFRFIQGPVFCQLLMADEINRASPRTQSALLQAMQERKVTVAGVDYPLPEPFHVLATRNPIEQEGTYPLPEAQLDRFLLEITIRYPEPAFERQMLIATTGAESVQARKVMEPKELQAMQALVRQIPIGETVVDAIMALVRALRPDVSSLDPVRQYVTWGPGPRAGQALMMCARARALLQGRPAPSLDDVLALAQPVFQHRLLLNYLARAEGVTVEKIIHDAGQSLR